MEWMLGEAFFTPVEFAACGIELKSRKEISCSRSFKSLPGMGALSSKTEVMSDDMKVFYFYF